MTVRRLAAIAAIGMGLSACAGATVSDLHDVVHDEHGVQGIAFDERRFEAMTLAEGRVVGAFSLPEFAPPAAFDRVGARWESIDAGGSSSVEVRVGGAWLPLQVDFRETVGEKTLYAGHVDLPAGSQVVRSRLALTRGGGASPRVLALALDAFVLGEVAQSGEPWTPESANDGTLPSSAPDGVLAFEASVVSRDEWGARAPNCLGPVHTPWRLTFHHTVTPNGDTGEAARSRMRQMQSYHMDSLGWCDIGYHFSVDADGVIYRGVTTSGRWGTHAAYHNDGNVGISLMGTYSWESPNDWQLAGLADALAWMASYWGIPVDGDRIRGHREWPSQSTACPGNGTLDRKGDILAAVNDRLYGGGGGGGSPVEVWIDNESGDFVASGNWWTSSYWPGYYGANYAGRDVQAVSDPAYWNAWLDEGWWEVWTHHTAAWNRTTAAPFLVYHADGTSVVHVNQQAGDWVSLGTYYFGGGYDTRVGLSCWTWDGEYVVADTVAFVKK